MTNQSKVVLSDHPAWGIAECFEYENDVNDMLWPLSFWTIVSEEALHHHHHQNTKLGNISWKKCVFSLICHPFIYFNSKNQILKWIINSLMGYGGTDPTPAKLWLHMLTRLNMKNEKRRRWKTKKEKLISPLSFRKVEPLQHSQYPPLQWDRTGTHIKNFNTDLQL